MNTPREQELVKQIAELSQLMEWLPALHRQRGLRIRQYLQADGDWDGQEYGQQRMLKLAQELGLEKEGKKPVPSIIYQDLQLADEIPDEAFEVFRQYQLPMVQIRKIMTALGQRDQPEAKAALLKDICTQLQEHGPDTFNTFMTTLLQSLPKLKKPPQPRQRPQRDLSAAVGPFGQ